MNKIYNPFSKKYFLDFMALPDYVEAERTSDLLYTEFTYWHSASKTRSDEYELVFYKEKPHKLLRHSSYGYGG